MLEIQKALPQDVVWVRDGGAIGIRQMHLLHRPISEHLMAMKQGMLGTGLPYANGAALAVAAGAGSDRSRGERLRNAAHRDLDPLACGQGRVRRRLNESQTRREDEWNGTCRTTSVWRRRI